MSKPENWSFEDVTDALDHEPGPQRDRAIVLMSSWLERGDGIAVYENQDLGSAEWGHKKFVSFGSKQAQLEVPEPPKRLPDIGGMIHWRYELIAVCRGDAE